MHKVTVLYGHPTDPAAFEEYYANNHLPIAGRIPNVQHFEASKVFATPDGSESPCYRSSRTLVRGPGTVAAEHGPGEGQAATDDIPNFATGGATVFISEVE